MRKEKLYVRIPLEVEFCAGEIYQKLLELEKLESWDYGADAVSFRAGNLFITVVRGGPYDT